MSGQGGSGSGAGAGLGSGFGGAVLPEAEVPSSARHAVVGAAVPPGCVTSVAQTAEGFAFAAIVEGRPVSGTGLPTPEGWDFSVEPRAGSGDRALVFGDRSEQVLAWSDRSEMRLGLRFLSGPRASDGDFYVLEYGAPVAGVRISEGFALLLSDQERFSLLKYDGSASAVWELRHERCGEPISVALDTIEDDIVAGYLCREIPTPSSSGASLLGIALVDAASGELEHTLIELEPAETDSAGKIIGTGRGAVTFTNGELLVAHTLADHTTALTRVSARDLTPRTTVVSGLPPTPIKFNSENPELSVLEIPAGVVLTRAVCDGREDNFSTGTVAVCHFAADAGPPVCSQFEAPCSGVRLARVGSEAMLLGCAGPASGMVIPLDLTLLPGPQSGLFPLGHSAFEPVALSCDGEACAALVWEDAAQPTTGYDRRLTFYDVDLPPSCETPGCEARRATPTSVHGVQRVEPTLEPELTVESQASGLPLAVVTVVERDEQLVPELAVLDRDGVRWSSTLVHPVSGLFQDGATVRGFFQTRTAGSVLPFTASGEGTVNEPGLAIRIPTHSPSMARSGDRVLIHAQLPAESSVELPETAILAYELESREFSSLFDPGYAPTEDYRLPPRLIGSAGDGLFMLDGSLVHRYSLSGERRPDVALRTKLSDGTAQTIFSTLVTRADDVVVVSANSTLEVLDVLLLRDDTVRAFTLPLPSALGPFPRLVIAPDRRDGWLRALSTSDAGRVFVSAWQLQK
jgi:hypothetical protein